MKFSEFYQDAKPTTDEHTALEKPGCVALFGHNPEWGKQLLATFSCRFLADKYVANSRLKKPYFARCHVYPYKKVSLLGHCVGHEILKWDWPHNPE